MTREVFREATGYFRIEVTTDMVCWVNERMSRWTHRNYKKMGNSDGTQAGLYGEAMFKWALPRAQLTDSFSHDFILDEFTVEVKTHISKHPPMPHFHQLIPDAKIKDSQTYAFVSLHDSMTYGWLIGWVMTKDIRMIGSFRKEGKYQEQTGFQYKCDCWEIPYERLHLFNSVDVR